MKLYHVDRDQYAKFIETTYSLLINCLQNENEKQSVFIFDNTIGECILNPFKAH